MAARRALAAVLVAAGLAASSPAEVLTADPPAHVLAAGPPAHVLAADPPAQVLAADPPARPPLLPPARATAATPTAAGLARSLAPALADPALGVRPAVVVVDAATGQVLLQRRGDAAVVPASTAKIATAVATLTVLDPGARLTTRVLAGRTAGDVVLVGAGDSTLAGPAARRAHPAGARVAALAARARAALGGVRVRRVLVDEALFGGPPLAPGWRPGYVTDGDVAPVGALQVDAGRARPGRSARVPDPARAAGRVLAVGLGAPAVPVTRGRAGPGAGVLAEVASPPVAALVERMLLTSDNDLAESLARHVALARGEPATFAGASAAVQAVLAELVPGAAPGSFALVDGSGLSRSDRLRPLALARLLAVVAGGQRPRLAPVLTGLPVAGFDGTLARRFRTGPAARAAGVVRAKTGTLRGVSALAGLLRTRDGRVLAFDLTADGVPPGGQSAAEAALDRLAARLVACGCR